MTYQSNFTGWQPYQPGHGPSLPTQSGDLPSYRQPLPDVTPYSTAWDPQQQQFDYGQVQNFADSAYGNAMRTLDPQMQLQDERFNQQLINQGIDPYSEAGQKAYMQKARGQNDLLSKAAYDSMGFGANIQNQMFGQHQANANLGMAANQQAYNQMMGLEGLNYRDYQDQIKNMQYQDQLGLSMWDRAFGQHQFDTTSGLAANQQQFNQMMGLEGLNYRDYQTFTDENRYKDSLALALAGMGPSPSYSTVNPGLSQGYNLNYGNQLGEFYSLYR